MAKKTKLSTMVAKAVPVKIVSAPSTNSIAGNNYVPSAKEKEQERRWKAEDDIRTMQRAEEIRRDKDRMKAMKEIAKEQMNNLKKIC